MSETETPTPRTDDQHAHFPMGGFTLDFARQLERELNEAIKQRDILRKVAFELITVMRVNLARKTFEGLKDSDLDEFLKPYIARINKPNMP